MLILGLQGSPRKKGNTDYLLSTFLDEAEKAGTRTHTIDVPRTNIQPCRGCGACEKTGYCVIKDDIMATKIYSLMRRADVIVAATPIFFYSMSAQLKGLVDRTQALWSRKYLFKVFDPGSSHRRGVVLSVGASRGKQLFDSVNLIASYFFDAVGADFVDSLTYRGIETAGEMRKHATVHGDIQDSVKRIITPLVNRKRVLFACRENAGRSQMAAAFTRYHAGEKINAASAGSHPANRINPIMAEAMAEKGLDMAFHNTKSLETAITDHKPQLIVTMGCGEECPHVPGAAIIDWDLPDPSEQSLEVIRRLRDKIEKQVIKFVEHLSVTTVSR